MSLVKETDSELFVTALSEIFEDLEISDTEENKDQFVQPLPSFKHFFEVTSEGLCCSTPKRPLQRIFQKRFIPMSDVDSTPQQSKTPEEVAKLAAPKEPELPLPKLPPVVLTPWSKIIRAAILEKEQKMKKKVPSVTQRMSMRL